MEAPRGLSRPLRAAVKPDCVIDTDWPNLPLAPALVLTPNRSACAASVFVSVRQYGLLLRVSAHGLCRQYLKHFNL